MYIRKVEIINIRSIEHFEMTFPEGKEAGWHVLIGENGAGKSTIARSIALCLIGTLELPAVRFGFTNLPRKGSTFSNINITTSNPDAPVTSIGIRPVNSKDINLGVGINHSDISPAFFSTSYGPFRRFTGGSKEWDSVYKNYPRAAAHVSVFGEDVALSESLSYIKSLYIKSIDIENIDISNYDAGALAGLIKFINQSNLLPHDNFITLVTSETVLVSDSQKNTVSITDLSDGFRSILSLVLDLLRQLLIRYKSDIVFKNIHNENPTIDFPGVVIIDEVDAHLHPTWQTQIGQWFTKYFPNFQFIVTTHSPLICRAAEKGSIWRLAAPGSEQKSGEITGVERNRLIYGNVLDAYSTEAFGVNAERSDSANQKLQRLAQLSQLNTYGKLSEEGKQEMRELRKILITDDTTEF